MMRFWFWLAGVLTAAAAVRVAHLFQTLDRPELRDVLLLDARVYDQMASQIAAGDLLAGDQAFSLGPLYAYFVALLRWIGPEGPSAIYGVYVAQQLLGLAGVTLIGLMARRCAGPLAGVIAAGLVAFYGPLGMFELKLMSSTLATFLGVASVALLLFAFDRSWTVGAGLAGMLLGAACLARPNTLLFAPLAIGWWVFAHRQREQVAAAAARWPVSQIGAIALGCGIVLAIAPATLRNQWVTGEFTLISSQAGITFHQGNNQKAYGLFTPGDGVERNPLTQPADQRRVAEAAAGHPLTQSQVGRYWFGRGLEYLGSDPVRAAGLVARKLGFWMSSDEIPVDYSLAAERTLAPALGFEAVPFGLILGLAFLSFRGAAWRDPRRVLLYLFILANLASILIFYFASRYRMPAVPMLAILAGCGVAEVVAMRRSPRELAAWVTGAILTAGLSLHTWTEDLRQSTAYQFFNYGNVYTRLERPELAVANYERALSGLSHMAQLHINLAVAYGALEKHEDAVRHLERALEIRPNAQRVQRALNIEKAKLRANSAGTAPATADPAINPTTTASPSKPRETHPTGEAVPRGHRHVDRLLVIALDGATWSWIDPLIEQGRLPVLAELRSSGVWASLETLEPTVSPAIWTTIATGTSPARHGILGFDGVPGRTMETLPNAGMRRVKAWWEMLDQAALTSGTIGWWASWPADTLRPGSYLVSDRVPYTRMQAAVERSTLDSRDTQPPDLLASVRDLVERPNDIDRDEAKRFLNLTDGQIDRWMLAADYTMGRVIPEFKFVYQSDRSTWKIARKLIGQQPVDLASVYFTGIDTVSHLCWHFSFPESVVDHTVAKKRIDRFGQVIPLYYELMDRYIGDLVAVAGEGTTVMVVSDHGFGATGRLPWSGGHGRLTPGAPIAPPGMLILSGPGIASDGRELEDAGVLDIAPTLLSLLGLPVAEDMTGRPLVEAMADRTRKEAPRIASWEEIGGPRIALEIPVDQPGDAERMERLRALGYIE